MTKYYGLDFLSTSMKHLIGLLFSILICILPTQSVLATLMVNRLGLPTAILLWKEAVIVAIATLLLTEIYIKDKKLSFLQKVKKSWMILLTSALVVYAVTTSVFKISTLNILYGFRFELFWVLFFAVLYTWYQTVDLASIEYLKQKIRRSIYLGFVPVSIISWFTIILGQQKVLTFFGFGASTSKLLSDIPVSQVVDGGGWNNLLRLSGSFATPNHFAGYLLLILPFFLYRAISDRNLYRKWWSRFAVANISLFVLLSFARFAWLAVLSWGLVLLAYYIIKNKTIQKSLFILAFVFPVFVGIVAINLPEEFLQKSLPTFLSKPSSTTFHARRTFAAFDVLRSHPDVFLTGYGLGASGPAAKDQYTSILSNPLYNQNIAISSQRFIQPRELVIPENWFLQLILNGGIFYAMLYSSVVLFPAYTLLKRLFNSSKTINTFDVYLLLAVFSIIIGNLFLHLWENQTVAIFYTTLIIFMYKPHKALV